MTVPLRLLLTVMLLGLLSARGQDDGDWRGAMHFPAGKLGPVLMHEGYAYVQNGWTRGDSVLIIDVREPSQPRLVQTVPSRGYLLNPGQVVGDSLFIPAYFSALQIAISQPDQAYLQRNLLLNFPSSDASYLAAAGDRLYVAGRTGLRVMDLSAAPTPLAHEPRFGSLLGLAASETRVVVQPGASEAYVLVPAADGSLTETARMKAGRDLRLYGDLLLAGTRQKAILWDLADAAAPAIATELPGYVLAGTSDGDRIPARHGQDLAILRVDRATRTLTVERELTVPADIALTACGLDGDLLCVVDRRRSMISLLDISGDAATLLGELPVMRNEGRMVVGDGHVYLTLTDGRSQQVLGLPAAPTAGGYTGFSTRVPLADYPRAQAYKVYDQMEAASLVRLGDYLLASDSLLDLSDPASPRVVHQGSRAASAVVVDQGRAYLAQRDRVTLLDVSALPALRELGVWLAPEGAAIMSLAARDGIVYAVGLGEGAQIHALDTRDPAAIEQIGACPAPAAVTCVLAGDHLYLPGLRSAERDATLSIVDVSEPARPKLARQLDGLQVNNSYRAIVHGDRLLLTDSMRGIRILDIADPLQPTLLRTLTGPTDLSTVYTDIAIVGDTLYGLRYSRVEAWDSAVLEIGP